MSKISILLLSFLIALYISTGNVHGQDDAQHPKIEIALVEVRFTPGTQILITHPDERTEIIDVDVSGKEWVVAQHRAIRSVLQRFYDVGWAIESEILVPNAPRAIYVLKRELR
jgi:hypothetical protein